MVRFIVLLLAVNLIAFPKLKAQVYKSSDTLNAQSYFKQSFQYSLNSKKHQLYLDSALMLIPTEAYYWQQKAMPLYKEHKWELGRPFLDSAVKYNQEKYLEYRGFMRCIFERRYLLAKEDFYLAKALYGNRYVMDHSYDFYLGLCCLQLNQFDSAQHLFDAVITEDQQRFGKDGVHFNHWFYRAMVSYAKEEYETCISFLDKAMTRHPQFADAHFYKANCLFYLNKQEEGKKEAQLAKSCADQHLSLNEDNAIYEWYPYQVRTYYYDNLINNLR
ncbi:MAG: hypothetical protein JNM95_09300 [Chitinophagaceae bacterium]|nr:hypothetical protein [Chitinophagaceae bacterium]